MSAETTARQKRSTRDLFTRVAANYDKINRIISLGQDRRWRKEALALLQLPPDGALLDVATGTGDVAVLARRQFPSVRIVGADLTPAMLKVARQKARGQTIAWMVGDGLALAHPDDTFDAVASAFMMRNVPDVTRAFSEQRRVVRPGGRIVCLEMTWPRRFPMSWLFKVYFFGLPPVLGQLIAGDREPYEYLPRSVQQFLTPEVMAEKMEDVGLRDVFWKLMMGGAVAVHVGTK